MNTEMNQTPLAHQTRSQQSPLPVLTLLTVLTTALCGCTVLTYTSPNGEQFSRRSFGASTSLSSLTVEADTNGVRRVELHGYTNDTAQALGTVTDAAVKAAIGALK
jgi:hypothetical protein